GLVSDMQKITDAGRGKWFSNGMMALALLKNYNPWGAPPSLTLSDIMKKFDKSFGLSGKSYGKVSGDRTMEDVERRRKDPWNFLFVAGMWFQDLFNYDFRRTEMCIIPYATQLGEISFCAYNTGIGWRKIIENMYKTASVADWNRKYGKHGVYAAGKSVPLDSYDHSLVLNPDDVARVRVHGDEPETAADEERLARQQAREAEKMKRMMNELTFGKNLGENEKTELVKIELAHRGK
ncbi:MAG TPA: radical SAM protein, partial [Terriglobia bacterium]|nr:radical SAM protein [Terriglobia bacterium]